MRKIALFLVLTAGATCLQLAMCGSPDTSTVDQSLSEAQRISGARSPSEQLLKELTKDQPPLDAAQNEKNARRLPQVMADSNAAVAKIQSGEDPFKALSDLQEKTR